MRLIFEIGRLGFSDKNNTSQGTLMKNTPAEPIIKEYIFSMSFFYKFKCSFSFGAHYNLFFLSYFLFFITWYMIINFIFLVINYRIESKYSPKKTNAPAFLIYLKWSMFIVGIFLNCSNIVNLNMHSIFIYPFIAVNLLANIIIIMLLANIIIIICTYEDDKNHPIDFGFFFLLLFMYIASIILSLIILLFSSQKGIEEKYIEASKNIDFIKKSIVIKPPTPTDLNNSVSEKMYIEASLR
jgi:hypothetical protein